MSFGAIGFCNQVFGLKLALQALTLNAYSANIALLVCKVDTDAATATATATAGKA